MLSTSGFVDDVTFSYNGPCSGGTSLPKQRHCSVVQGLTLRCVTTARTVERWLVEWLGVMWLCVAATCSEWYRRGLEDDTYAMIDPDGTGSEQPFTAYCQRVGTNSYTIVRTYIHSLLHPYPLQ